MNESTKRLGEIVHKPDVEGGTTQTPGIEKITGTHSLSDTSTLMKRSKYFFNLKEKSIGDVFWIGIIIQPLGENRINVKNEEYDITPNIQNYFTNTKLTTKSLNINKKQTVFDILNVV